MPISIKSQDLTKEIKSPNLLLIENISALFQPVRNFTIDPVGFILKNVTDSKRVILNTLIDYSNKYKEVFVSQETLAKDTGYDVRTIKRALTKLDEWGLIRKNFRWNHTSTYDIAAWFMHVYNKRRLSHIFKGLRVNQPRRYYSGTYEQWRKLRKSEGVWMKEYTCKNVKFDKKPKRIFVSKLQDEPRRLQLPDQTDEIGNAVDEYKDNPFLLAFEINNIRKRYE